MKESHLRTIIKATSWRLFGTFSTTVLAYVVTHRWDTSLYIGMLEFVSKIGLFYVHERLWFRVPFGMGGVRVQDAVPENE
jgi:uncharacterized membrane protein